ncbi:MAG: EAL domain-containing protein [Geobacteraceae bacterium]|nr:EAL domain-containing protein [Geobacteraceae bacterium]
MGSLSCALFLPQIPDAAIVVDRQARILHYNRRAEQLFGYGPDELQGLSLHELLPPDKRENHAKVVAGFMDSPASRPMGSGLSFVGQRKDGTVFPADITLGAIGAGPDVMVLATIRDVTAQKQAETELQQANRAMRLLSASNRTLLRSTREDEQLAQVCRIAVEIGGYRLAWVGIAQFDEEKSITPATYYGAEQGFLSQARMSWAEGERGTSAMSTAIRTGTIQLRQDILNDPQLAPWHEDARARNYQSAIALPLRLQDEVIGALAIYAPEPQAFHEQEVALLEELADDLAFGIQNLRMQRAHEDAQAHVQQLAYYDRLTGLPNRIAFTEQFDRDLAAAAAEGHTISLLLLDLNYLREINETHGHSLGDQVLVRVAGQLQQLYATAGFIARFSGNDFTIICPKLDQFGAAALGEKILATISTPFYMAGNRFVIGGNIGVAVYPSDGDTSAELLSKVDLAMTRAKETGNGCCFYRPEMGQRLARTLELAHRLERAIHDNQLELYYQPQIALLSGKIVGAEALLRWHEPELGWISPAEFIPVAEARGMMMELGGWVLRTACHQIRQWQDSGLFCQGRIAINVSARQLDDPDFPGLIGRILEEAGVPSSCLELELTESVLMTDPQQVISILSELKEQGFALAIDDFGTGYSSLAYLKRFPVDTLKIDQTFVREMLLDQNDRAIVATIIAMAQQLGLTTVAEGVEFEEQRQMLQELGCVLAQGFLFSRPEPSDEFTRKRLIQRDQPEGNH